MTLKSASKWMSVLSLSLVLAACGSGETSDGSSDSSGDTATEETTSTDSSTEDTSTEDDSSEAESTDESSADDQAAGDFDTSQQISVVNREEGSGTRDAFTEIVGLLDDNGNDLTSLLQNADIQNSTGAVMSTVGRNETAIGYISTGSLDDSVQAVSINGAEPSAENIQVGDYEIARNFNIAYGEELSEAAQDFWDFIMSSEGQAVVEEEGFIAVDDNAPSFEGGDAEGEVTIAGSTSVTPVMEALAEEYESNYNENVTVGITSNGSGAGMEAAMSNTADIGMASRELEEEEAEAMAGHKAMAIDGIAVIVHNSNPVEDLSLEDVEGIYKGEITVWDEVIN